MEHELSEVSGNLKQSLTANTEYAERFARADAEREIAEGRATKLDLQVAEMAVENARMKKVVEKADNKSSMLHARNSKLKAEKGVVETELDMIINETLELRNQSFF